MAGEEASPQAAGVSATHGDEDGQRKLGTGDPPYRLDHQVGYLLRLASQRHAAILQSMMGHDLTATQFAMLIRLGEVGEGSQNHLGRLIHTDVATTKGVVDRLTAKGLVTVSRDPSDARRRVVALSENGRRILPELQQTGRAITEATLEPLTEAERAAVVALLGKLG